MGHACAGKEGKWRYSSNPFATTVLDAGGWSAPLPGHFTHTERPGTHFRGGWMSLEVNLDGHRKFRAQGYPNIGTCNPYRVAYIYIYIYMCVCVCVRARARAVRPFVCSLWKCPSKIKVRSSTISCSTYPNEIVSRDQCCCCP